MEEYDEIYAAYADAKAKMNQMRVSRGFYPVVAVVERPYTLEKESLRVPLRRKEKAKREEERPNKDRLPPVGIPREVLRRHEERLLLAGRCAYNVASLVTGRGTAPLEVTRNEKLMQILMIP